MVCVMNETPYRGLGRWLDEQLAAREWGVSDLANHSGLNRSGIQRWKAGTHRPDIDNARILADAFGRPLLELLVAADYLTPEEARQRVAARVDPSVLTNRQLLSEIERRLNAAEGVAPTRDDVAASPDDFVEGGPLNHEAKGARKRSSRRSRATTNEA